jgi:MHS family alpha-ketoglutarate permease-like MFS transporter
MASMAGWGYGGLFWIYLAVISAISLVVYLRMPETRGQALR